MRKAVLFPAVIAAAMAVAIFWYGDAKAADPADITTVETTVDLGTEINWTIPEDPDCNASLWQGYYDNKVTESIKVMISSSPMLDHGLSIGPVFDSQGNETKGMYVGGTIPYVTGTITAPGAGYSDRHPFYIYVDVISKVELSALDAINTDAIDDGIVVVCSNWRWWQINVTIPVDDDGWGKIVDQDTGLFKPNEKKAHSGNINNHQALPGMPTAPDVPDAPTLTVLSAISIQAVGVAPDDGGSSITSYDWQYREVDTSGWFDRVNQTSLTRTFSNLAGSTKYEFQFRATNNIGASDGWSPTATAETLASPASTDPLSKCSYYHDHDGGLGSYGSTNCIYDDAIDEYGYVIIGKKTSIETDYHWHENDNDNGGVPHSGGVSHNSP